MCVYDTSPHMVDPANPGAVDEILNLGTCWNEDGFKAVRTNIIETNKEIGKRFKRAYRYLEAAKALQDDWSNYNSEVISVAKLNKFKEDLKEKIFKMPISTSVGTERHLFATAFTPNGIVTSIDTLYVGYKNIFVFNGGPGTGKTEVLNFIAKEALKRGLSVEFFHTPLDPEKIEHILIPEISVACVTSNEINKKDFVGQQFYMENIQNTYFLNKNRAEIQQTTENFYLLLTKALTVISSAKELHDLLETYYIPNMDFSKLDAVYENILEKILGYEKSYLEEKKSE